MLGSTVARVHTARGAAGAGQTAVARSTRLRRTHFGGEPDAAACISIMCWSA